MANCLPSLMPIEMYGEQHDSKEYSGMKIKDSAYHAIGKLNHNVNANGQSVKESKPTHAKTKSGHGAAGGTKGRKASAAKGKKQTDITRCNIRERVIQMLAVKPLKRLELYTRLRNEGLRDSERSVIGTVLRDVALFRDNIYILRHYIWNNVKDDWPFYSEQERQQLQTNKQQNLAPPVSSDAASLTSGQGPPLRNSSSPPQLATDCDSNGGKGLKRPNQEYCYPVPSKKRRISHLLTKERVENHMNSNNASTLVQHRNVHAIKDGEECSGIIDCVTNTSKKPTELKKKSEVPVSHQPRKSNSGNNKEEIQTKIDLSESSKKQSSSSRSKDTTRKSTSKKDTEESTIKTHVQAKSEKKPVPKSTNLRGPEAINCVEKENSQHRQHVDSQQRLEQQISAQQSCKPEEPQLQLQQQHSSTISADTANPQGFDFRAYVPIRSIEQRRLYKAEFERDYAEYSQLLEHVEHVRRSFETLTSLLKQLPPGSPKLAYVNQEIIDKYELLNTREEKQRLQRFIYLHYKLEHITLLVRDYDKILTSLSEAAMLRQQQQQNNSTQLNGHGLAMDTNSKAEAELVQPVEVPTQNMKQLKTNRKECEPRNDHSKDQIQLKNVVGISPREAAPFSGAQQAQQESKHISDHPNHQEEDSRSSDSSSSESSDDSSDSSSESDDSSDSESSDDSSDSSSESDDSSDSESSDDSSESL